QVVYMIWNAINDPLFGYIQDNSSWAMCRSRKKAIYYGAPLWALFFLLPWFQWADYNNGANTWLAGIHLIVTLCAYDSMLTFVLLAQCALFAEISTKPEDRLRLVKYQQIASVIGSSSVFLSSLVSNNMKNFINLQIYCVGVAVLAFVCMRYSSINVNTKYEMETYGSSDNESLADTKSQMSAGSACQITKQILFNRNFISFVLMNFFQVFHVTFCSNFLLIFADHLIPKNALPSLAMSVLYGASFVLPQVIILLGGDVIMKFGAYRVVMVSFFVQFIAAIALFLVGSQYPWLLAAFFILDMSIPSAAFSLFNIPLSDIIDEDAIKYNRKHPQSSMVFGTNALITKPANSLAPMLVVAVLNSYGYEHLKDYGASGPPLDPSANARELMDMHSTMFLLLCFIPVILSLAQIVVWSFYGLRDSHTTEAKYVES
uniref:Major facilitator superfamily associated domain-containing protein n=1 Tax=Ciona savignyi TaxID=51511 RepID=H2YRD7_CIOSA